MMLNSSRSRVTTVPFGKAARATRAVSAGISPIGSGRRLMLISGGGMTFQDFADSIFSSSGIGATAHLISEWFNTSANLQAVHVPFPGSAPALNAVVAGQVDYTIETLAA